MAEENEIKVQNDGSLFIAVGSGQKRNQLEESRMDVGAIP